MSELGFYADIQGVTHLLTRTKEKDKVWDWMINLGNDLCRLDEFISGGEKYLGRLLVYQLGDGFFIHFE